MAGLNLELEQLSLSNLSKKIETILQGHQSSINKRIKKSIVTRIERNGLCHLCNYNYFPLDNDVDLTYMETKVTAGSEFRSRLLDDLKFIGGENAKDMVFRLMPKLFSMKLLSGYSREGGQITRRLSGLKIYDVIREAVITNFPNSQENFKQAIDGFIKTNKKNRTPRQPV